MIATPSATAIRARQSRRAAIETFFLENLRERFSTMLLHERFGTPQAMPLLAGVVRS